MPISALIGAVSDLIGNGMNSSSQSRTNQMNYQIAQMNNQYNERMLQKQMDYNTQMWNAQNAYNTPAAQRQRYEEAGINPYMALGNIVSGQAGSAGGVNPPTASPVTMQPTQYDFSGIGQAAQNYVANSLVKERNSAVNEVDYQKAEQLRIENQYKAAELASNIWNKIENTNNFRMKNIYQGMLNDTYMESFNSDMLTKQREREMIETSLREKEVEIAMKEIHLLNLPQQYQLSFASMAADTALSYAQRDLTKQQAFHELQKKWKTMAETYGIKINNRILEASANDIIEKAAKENKAYYWNVGSQAIGHVVDGFVGFGLGRLGKVMDGSRSIIKGFGR